MGYFFISFIAIIMSVISASYYLKIIKVIFFDQANKSANMAGSDSATPVKEKGLSRIPFFYNIKKNIIINTISTDKHVTIDNTHSLIISILTLVILLFILNPDLIFNSIHLLAVSLFYV
jgi:NADH-ubiquinone oxidoreductase chain 2